MDRFEALATFVSVADNGGFARAARKLERSPAAVTRSVAALETSLGTQLFRRTTRVVSLTDAGARFLVDARRILADLEESTTTAAGAQTDLRGNVVVTAPVMFGNLHVVPVLLSFLRAHPEVTGRAVLHDRVVDLLDESVDVAIRIAHLRDSSLRAIRVGAVRAVCCASPGYLEKHGKPRAPNDLRAHATIAYSGVRHAREWLFPGTRRAKRVLVSPRFVTNDTQASITAATAGHGVVRALSYQVAAEVRAGRLVVVLERFEPSPIPVHVVHAAGASAPARIRAFVDYAVDRLRSDPRLDLPTRRRSKTQPGSRK